MAPKRASRIMRLQKPNSKRDDFDSTYVRHFIYFDAKHAMDFVRALLIITRLCLGCQSVLIWNAILFKWNQYKINALQHDFRSRTLFINNFLRLVSLADPGGAHPARAPPNGRGPMIFLCPKRYFSLFFLRSLRSRLIFSIVSIEIWPKTR